MRLTINDAKTFVRARIDELAQTNSDMYSDITDDRNLGRTIEESIPEAIASVHMSAPASLLEGITIDETSDKVTLSINKRVLSLDFSDSSITDKIKMIRLVSFKCGDGIAISSEFPEDSPEGRMQLNRFVQGQPDEPVLVRESGSPNAFPRYKYYTTDLKMSPAEEEEKLTFKFVYFPAPLINASPDTDPGNAYYFISALLKYQTLNYLTALVLVAYSRTDIAQLFFNLAKNQ